MLLTGQLNLIFVLVLIFFTLADLIWGYRYPIPFNLGAIAGGVVVYFVNRSGHFMTARLILTGIVTLLVLYFTSVLERDLGVFQFAICINVGIMAVFGYEHSRVAMILVAIITALFLVALFHPYPRITSIRLADPAYRDRNLFFGFIVASVSAVTITYYLLLINHKVEESLQEKERSITAKNQELTEVNAELDRFFYSVSHDLRSPLSSLQGLLALLEHTKDPQETREYIELLRGRVDNLDHFVRTITAYASNTRTAVAYQPVSLHTLLKEALENVRFLPDTKGIAVTLDVPTNVEFHSDPARLEIIFGNLLGNAFKYHDVTKAKPFIRITSEPFDHAIIIRIQDNGIGMNADVLPRVFDKFYRGNGRSQGSGLGLYIVKEAVEKLNGTIGVSSTPGEGTTFTVTLPTEVQIA